MGKRTRKIKAWLGNLLLLLIVAAVAGAGYYFYRGGTLGTAQYEAQRLAGTVKQLGEEAKAKGEGLLSSSEGQPDPAEPESSESVDPGAAIQVYFAPCNSLNPRGIDDRFIAFLDSAQDSIYGAFYEFELPEAADVLIGKHQAGVAVGLVTDSDYEDREALTRCIEAGIPVTFDKREAFMHDKFCIVDGRRVWTGSTNITENCMYRNNNNAIVLDSLDLATDYSNEFEEMFRRRKFGARSPLNTDFPEVVAGGVRVECYFSPEDGVAQEIVAEIADADATVDFMAFSFTSKEIAEAMAARIEQGVAVRGLFETRNAGSEYSRDEYLAERGATIYLDTNKDTMHHKVIVIDGETVVTGSYNFSASAEEENDENLLIVHSPEVAALFTKEFESLTQ